MSYTEHRDCTAIRTYQSTNTVNYYLRIGKDDENTVLVASIEMDNNDIPIPRKGERIIFDIDSPVNLDPEYEDYITAGEIYKVKQVIHCYNGTEANLVVEVIMEIDDDN